MMLDFSARWTLWFESPNHLGAWATAVYFVLFGLLLLPQMKFEKNKWLPVAIILALGFIVCSLLIAWSASRASWVAVAVEMIFAAYFIPTKKSWGLIALGVITMTIGIVSVDRMRDRAMTVTEMGQDGSSQSRPRTWSAACRMAAAHPIGGIGEGNFTSFYTNWYEPEERNDTLRTANNDVLHIMAEHGVILATLLLALYGLSLTLLIEGVKHQRGIILGLSLSGLSFFINGLFNNVITFHLLWPWVAGVMILTFGACIRLLTWKQIIRRGFLCCTISLALCLTIIGYGRYLLQGEQAILLALPNKAVVVPTKQSALGNIIVGGENDDRPRTFYRGVMRSLAEQGWQSELALGEESLQQALNSISNDLTVPTYVIALRASSAFMLAKLEHNATWAQKLNGAILCDVTIPEQLRVEQVPFPLMIIYGRLESPSPPPALANFVDQLHKRTPTSTLYQAPWGTTWARLIKRLSGDINDWLKRTHQLKPLVPHQESAQK
jgi:general stress protein CsbA